MSEKSIALCLFRGKWTYDMNKSIRPNKKELKMQFPEIYGGTIFDIVIYKLYYVIKRFI